MKKNNMQATNTIAKVFETVLSIPGMNANVKIQLSIPRKNVLLLSKVIERGLARKEDVNDAILDIAPKETLQDVILCISQKFRVLLLIMKVYVNWTSMDTSNMNLHIIIFLAAAVYIK